MDGAASLPGTQQLPQTSGLPSVQLPTAPARGHPGPGAAARGAPPAPRAGKQRLCIGPIPTGAEARRRALAQKETTGLRGGRREHHQLAKEDS